MCKARAFTYSITTHNYNSVQSRDTKLKSKMLQSKKVRFRVDFFSRTFSPVDKYVQYVFMDSIVYFFVAYRLSTTVNSMPKTMGAKHVSQEQCQILPRKWWIQSPALARWPKVMGILPSWSQRPDVPRNWWLRSPVIPRSLLLCCPVVPRNWWLGFLEEGAQFTVDRNRKWP